MPPELSSHVYRDARPFAGQMTRLDIGGLDQDQSSTGCGEA
jgi:hypothetical protein